MHQKHPAPRMNVWTPWSGKSVEPEVSGPAADIGFADVLLTPMVNASGPSFIPGPGPVVSRSGQNGGI
ncbi:hypothetical protein GCM10009596_11330 [Arthrobacter rhombi]